MTDLGHITQVQINYHHVHEHGSVLEREVSQLKYKLGWNSQVTGMSLCVKIAFRPERKDGKPLNSSLLEVSY